MAFLKVAENQRIGTLRLKVEAGKTKYNLSGVQNFKNAKIKGIFLTGLLPNQYQGVFPSIRLVNMKSQVIIEELGFPSLNLNSPNPFLLDLGILAWDKCEITMVNPPSISEVGTDICLHVVYEPENG